MEVWIGRDGERHGPYKEADVRQWLRSGQVSREDLAWYDGLADWQPLSVLFPDEVRAPAPAPAEASETPAFTAPPVAAPLPRTTSAALEDYAGFWKRFGAWVIDYLILMVPITIIAVSMGATAAFEHFMAQMHSGTAPAVAAAEYGKTVRPATIIAMIIGFIYYVAFECSKLQATPGKLAVGMRVTDLNGQRLGVGRSVARNVIRLVNVITALLPFICYIVTAWTERKQGLHDMMAKTLVLNGRASEFHDAPVQPSTGGGSFNA
ncbi:RDD family protein [Rhodanobacter glycinis]|uniref:RDD family protein n=1 Tax=Rhodanobacter glycinis TaxID=582702 RepID=A0A5B9E545_9GAMM|nr:RDD family protein [Rhodanobacter glycinis]QEE26195.1 RDD family protein [Rhodanobacter glycinis]